MRSIDPGTLLTVGRLIFLAVIVAAALLIHDHYEGPHSKHGRKRR